MGKKRKNKNTQILECPDCGKKTKKTKINFCPSCDRELFIPVLDKNWNYKILAVIFLVITLLYILFVIFKPKIYYFLDKV